MAAHKLRWLKPQDFWTKHHEAKSQRLPGTLQWLIDSPQFRRWLDKDQHDLVYVADNGTGKAIAVSLIVDTLFEKYGAEDKVGIAFLYAPHQDSHGAERLLQSLLIQLGRRIPKLPRAVKDIYAECEAGQSQATVAGLLNGISAMLASLSKIFFVIDALDQLPTLCRQTLRSGLLGLRKDHPVKLFATSQFDMDLSEKFERYSPVRRGKTATTSDFTIYVKHAMRALPDSLFEGQESRIVVEKKIVDMSLGLSVYSSAVINIAESFSFSWADLIITRFANEINRENMDTKYHAAMFSIEHLPIEEQSFVKTALAWILLAKRPLEEEELRHVLALDRGFPVPQSSDDLLFSTMTIKCILFVHPDSSRTGRWSLSDQSAAHYLTRNLDTWCPKAQAIIAKACLACLVLDTFSEGYCETTEKFELRPVRHPFYKYAAQHWVDHLDGVEDLPEKLVCLFLLDRKKVASAKQATMGRTNGAEEKGSSQMFDEQESGLHLAAQFGLVSVVTVLLAQGERPALKDGQGRTPLWRATENSRTEAMKLLSSWDRISFTLMLNMDRAQLAHSLLQCTGQTIRDSRSRTPLHIGVIRKDMELIRLCIAQGLDINAKDMDGRTPLHLAISDCEAQVVELLLENGASTELIVAGSWSEAFGKAAAEVLMLVEDANGKKRVEFLAVKSFQRSGLPITDNAKRLL